MHPGCTSWVQFFHLAPRDLAQRDPHRHLYDHSRSSTDTVCVLRYAHGSAAT